MSKRDLFAELSQGFDELKQEREGKITLKQSKIKTLPPVEISGKEVERLRASLNMSQAVFAAKLRVNERTLKGWENGRKVNSTAATLIRLVQKQPELLETLAEL